MPSRRMMEAYLLLLVMTRYGEALLSGGYFEDLAQARYDREFWDLVGAGQ